MREVIEGFAHYRSLSVALIGWQCLAMCANSMIIRNSVNGMAECYTARLTVDVSGHVTLPDYAWRPCMLCGQAAVFGE